MKFAKEQDFSTGQAPDSVVSADVNGDGKVDLVVANYGSNSVSVLLGNGNGTFQAEQTFSVGKHPQGVAVADVNGDGKPDLIATSSYSGTVSVLLGNGNGTFQSQVTSSAGSGAATVVAADVNGDGKPDLIVTNEFAYTVSVLLGNGNGTFQAQRTFAVGSFPQPLAVGDVNGDGKPDLVVSNNGATTVSILLSNGNGTFQAQQTVNVAVAPSGLALADLNADGKLDLVVASSQSIVSSVGVLLGNGNGTFRARQTFATSRSPSSVVVADFNGDGKPDLAVANYSNQTVGVLLGNGNGTFRPQQTTALSSFPGQLAATDLDGDGIPDLIVLEQSPNRVGVLLNESVPPRVLSINRTNPAGASTGSSRVTFTITFSKAVAGVNLGDFSVVTNGVSFSSTSFATLSSSVYTVTVGGISGAGTLGLNLVDNGTIHDLAGHSLVGGPPTYSSPQSVASNAYTQVLVADLNGDGKPDLLFPYSYSSPLQTVVFVQVYLGNGNGTFQAPFRVTLATPISGIAVADMNGDGHPDLDVMYSANGTSAVGVLLANGNGTFKPTLTQATPYPGSDYGLKVADLNGDGKADVLVGGGAGLAVLLGNGNGTLQAARTIFTGPMYGTPVIADVNGDSNPDLLFVSASSVGQFNLAVLLGNGNGTFAAPHSFGSGHFYALAVTDVNGDGLPDVVASDSLGRVDVFLGNGNGTFQPQQTFALGATGVASGLSLSDFNGDNIPDALTVAATRTSGAADVLLGNGNGTFAQGQTFNVGQVPYSISGADLNGDGIPDLIVRGSSNFAVLLGQTNGSFTGQTYTIIPINDVISGSTGNDAITLTKDTDGIDIDWTLTPAVGSPSSGALAINDPNGLTILGNGGSDTITLTYTNGNPLPNLLHLNGTFTVNSLQGTNPLAGTNLEIGKSTVYVDYGASDPLAAIEGYLKNGYNGGGWNGTPTATTGVITSTPAQTNSGYMIGYADSADGVVTGQPANTIELKYTLGGDLNLAGTVVFADFAKVVADFGKPAPWDGGAITYGATVSFADFALTVANFGKQAVTTTAGLATLDAAATLRATKPASSSTPVPLTSKLAIASIAPAPAVVRKRGTHPKTAGWHR